MQDFESDLSSLSAKRDLNRRQMLATSLAVGFAAAVQPVCAQTAITTDSNGLTAGEVKIPVQDGEIPAYRAMPAKGGPFPLILVVQEIFGVHEHIKDICRRLAKVGYIAIAPELYARQGDVAKHDRHPRDHQQGRRQGARRAGHVRPRRDRGLRQGLRHGRHRASLGITGFCWGGRIVWLYAAHNPSVKAGVAWYGKLVGDPSTANSRNSPIDLVGDLKAPVLGLYGGADTGIPVDTIEKMRSACQAAGKICEFVIYPDTPHAFYADYRPSYREGPAKDGWARMLAWFRSHGVA